MSTRPGASPARGCMAAGAPVWGATPGVPGLPTARPLCKFRLKRPYPLAVHNRLRMNTPLTPRTLDVHDLGYEPSDLRVTISELMVATSDQSDAGLDRSISDVLKLLRERLHMDVVFCSEFVDGQRVIRQAATPLTLPSVTVGQSDSLEASWCQRVVEGRLPRFIPDTRTEPSTRALAERTAHPIGTHISTPIVLKSGQVYGTLCGYTFSPQDNPKPDDLKTLEMTARLIAMRLDGQLVMPAPKEIPDWDLKPK